MSSSGSFDRLTALISGAAAVVSEVELDTLLRRLVTEARSATGARYAALGVLGEHGVLTDFIHEGLDADQAARIGELPSGKGVLGTVIRENKTIRVETIGDHPDSFGFPPHHPPMTSFLGVPISVGSEAFGNLYLTDKEGGFTDDDVVLVEALSRIAGSAVQTARLHDRLRRLAVTEDRARIARDLHDSVIQDLFAVGLSLQSVSARVGDLGASEVLDDSVDRLDDAVEALRAFIFQLQDHSRTPTALDEVLQDLIARMGSAYPSTVTLEYEVESPIEPDLEDEIVKIITEALSNALRHSDADTVQVYMGTTRDTWVLRVSDDGHGFDIEGVEFGLGLLNMKTRAAKTGADFSLVSNYGEGTTVTAAGPLT